MEEQTQAQESLLDSTTTTETNTETTPATETAPTTDEQRPEWLPEKFKTAEDFAKSYSELEKKIQQKQPEIPTEYDYSYAGDLGLDMNDEQKSQTNEVFRHYGLTQEQAKGMLSLYSDSIRAFADQYTAQGPQVDMTVEQGHLKQTWGTEYDAKMGAVRNFAKTLKNDTLNAPLANTAEGLQILADAMAYRNGTNPIADGGVASTQSAADIRARINELRQSDSYKLPQGDIVGEQTRAEIYKLYQQLERLPR